MIYCSHTQKSHQVAARSSSVAGFLIPRRSFISVSSRSWKVSLRIAVISCKDWSVGRRWGWLLNIYMLCVWVRKVVSCAGRLFEISIEISCWCSQQYFIFFSLSSVALSQFHMTCSRNYLWWSHFSASICLYPNLTCSASWSVGIHSQSVQQMNCWIILWLFHEAVSDWEPYIYIWCYLMLPQQCWCIVSYILMLYLFYSVDIHRRTLATPIYAWIHHLSS